MPATTVRKLTKTKVSKAAGRPASGPGPGRVSTFPKVIRENPQLFDGVGKFGDFISVVDFADIFGVTTNTVRGWIKNGFLPNPRISSDPGDRKQYLPVKDVIKAMRKHTEV